MDRDKCLSLVHGKLSNTTEGVSAFGGIFRLTSTLEQIVVSMGLISRPAVLLTPYVTRKPKVNFLFGFAKIGASKLCIKNDKV